MSSSATPAVSLTPFAERAKRIPLYLPPDRVRALIEAEIAAAAQEVIAACVGVDDKCRRRVVGVSVRWCDYCGQHFLTRRRHARYCCASHRVAACKARRRSMPAAVLA
jgi:hypothetical protein